ncbi:sensor histidine kinase [Actinocrispum wychmicini]|uniref:histidine kinase n=1 Tax=Actinocrispum wychmicini TaxID=1213861 RepID=A0A4R2JX57_9PSEU|nr:sensor histidine kinase [Actinocrispum wychmicini]TCO65083.1 signal transduction histidine kinase [Actinocrispum wychmicini]
MSWLALGAMVLGCVPLIWRRRRPVLVLATIAPALVASVFWHLDSGLGLVFVAWIALYGVPAYAPRRHANITGVAVIVVAVAVLAAMVPVTEEKSQGGVMLAVVTMVGYLGSAWALGLYHRVLQDQARTQATAEERTRIARELHDMLAHTMSGMVILAGGGRRAARTDPAAAVAVLAEIEQAGRQGMAETRALVDSLRGPTLANLSTLVDRIRRTGLPVQVTISGEARVLPLDVDLATYRIVQESLTNVLRHAGPATARVYVRYLPNVVEVRVDDDGCGGSAEFGHGLKGMRERACLAGGELTAGPAPDGGWSVRAVFPA